MSVVQFLAQALGYSLNSQIPSSAVQPLAPTLLYAVMTAVVLTFICHCGLQLYYSHPKKIDKT